MNVLELTNKVRMEAEDVKSIGLPLDAFPQKLQDIIFEVARIEQFDLEYLTMSMLSAAATAIGNSCTSASVGHGRVALPCMSS